MKKCSKCGQEKQLAEYHKDRRGVDGLYGWCKSCAIEKARAYRERFRDKVRESQRQTRLKNPHVYKNKMLKYTFGITLEQYEEMLKNQNYSCAVCGKEETEIHPKSKKVKNLNVDHCHSTGKIRGILCGACNRGIGLLKDDPKILLSAIEYLKRNSPPA
jgi:hypothetical protein